MASNPDNRLPGCLSVELRGTSLGSKRESSQSIITRLLSSKPKQVDLYLTIHFGEQWEDLGMGRFKFGLRGGELRLKLENCKILERSRGLSGLYNLSHQRGQRDQDSEAAQERSESPLVSPESPLDFHALGVESTLAPELRGEPFDEPQTTTCQITPRGSGEDLTWIFAVRNGEPTMKGGLVNEKLGTVSIESQPCRIEATFTVSKGDVSMTAVDGLWPADISSNKRAWIELEIALWLFETRFRPYLSWQELRFPELSGAAI